MKNEAIVSSFVYVRFHCEHCQLYLIVSQCYDSENVTEGRLAFRRATSWPHSHEQNDVMCMKVLYNMDL